MFITMSNGNTQLVSRTESTPQSDIINGIIDSQTKSQPHTESHRCRLQC